MDIMEPLCDVGTLKSKVSVMYPFLSPARRAGREIIICTMCVRTCVRGSRIFL